MKLNKYLTVSVAGIVAATMVGCSNKHEGMTEWSYEDRKKATHIDYDRETTQDTKTEEVQVVNLIDDDRIKVDLMGACDGMLGAEIWFEIENKKDYPIKIQSRDMSVNGYMENTIMSVDVMPGMKAKDRMIFSNINSIDDLVGVQGKLWLINNNDVSNSGTYDIVIN